jgi:hypothetical protein
LVPWDPKYLAYQPIPVIESSPLPSREVTRRLNISESRSGQIRGNAPVAAEIGSTETDKVSLERIEAK